MVKHDLTSLVEKSGNHVLSSSMLLRRPERFGCFSVTGMKKLLYSYSSLWGNMPHYCACSVSNTMTLTLHGGVDLALVLFISC